MIPEFVVERVDPERMKVVAALLRDPNMIHLDRAEVAALGMGERVVNQGPLNFGYIHTMLSAWAGGDDRVLDTRFRLHGNVFEGDRVVAGGRVVAEREGVAECEVWLDRWDRGAAAEVERVVTGRARCRVVPA